VDPYRVLLADDHVMFRQGIRNLIEKVGGIQIIGEVNDGLELLEFLKTSVPDLIILDIAMPKLRGLEAMREVKKNYRNVKIILLTMYGNQGLIRQAINYKTDGFILKEEQIGELIHAIKEVRSGRKYFSSIISEALVSLVREEKNSNVLTDREKEILQFMARGMGNQEIASSLFISVHTVRRHRYNIMEKLDMHSVTELMKYAISEGYC
jgi:DNA-binding NarL/FixJ family response regulator